MSVIIQECSYIIVWPWLATKGPYSHSAAPPPAGVQRRMERKQQKLMGWDMGSLTEQQTKGTVATTIQIRRIYNTNSGTHRATLTTVAARTPELRLPSCHPAPPSQNPA